MDSEDTTQPLPRAIVDLERRLAALEEKFQVRGYDTRPFFEEHQKRIAALEATLAESAKRLDSGGLVFKYTLYWALEDEVPFCPQCWESKPNERRHLQPGGNPGQYWCTNCKNHFDDPRFNTEPIDDTETRLYRNRRPLRRY